MRSPNGDLIVVLPGILGSELYRGGRQTWGFGQTVRNIGNLAEQLTQDLALDPLAFQDAEIGFNDGTVVEGVLRSVSLPPRRLVSRLPKPLAALIPGFWTILDGYDLLLSHLVRTFDARDVIAFPYDWRQSNRVSATRLKRHLEPIMSERRRTYPAAQAVLVGHSMGGLVARYYAECLDYQHLTSRVVTIGTPYQGAVKALSTLANGGVGSSIGAFDLTINVGTLVRSFPSVAELLPTFPCLTGDDGLLAQLTTATKIPGLPEGVLKHGLAFHQEIAMAVEARGPIGPIYTPILSHQQPTAHSAEIRVDRLKTYSTTEFGLGGDGTVLRVSAIPPEWVDRGGGTFVNGRHANLQHASGVWDQLLGTVSGGSPRAPMTEKECLISDVPDFVAVGDRFRVRARAASGNKSLALVASIQGGIEVQRSLPLHVIESGYEATVQLTIPGIYRWTIDSDPYGNSSVDPVSDVLICSES